MTPTPTPATPPPKRRVRTEAQLNQKRLADRIKHKENRHEGKQRLERMESSISGIQSKLDSLALQLQSLPRALTAPVSSSPPVLDPGQAAAALHTAYGPGDPPKFSFNASLPWSGLAPTPPRPSAANNVTKIWGYVPSEPGPTRLLDCRCGLQHPDHFNCLESCNVTALYRGHVGDTAMGSTSPFPRNPSLPSMMLHQGDENMLTFFITGCLQQCRTKSIEQLLGFYLLGYRYMRWQMHPNANTIQDIPPWILPTEAQKTHPHSVVVDFLAWPRLRDYICTSGDVDPRHSLQFYFDSIQLAWPPDRALFAQSETGQIVLSPEFERVVFELESWRLGPPWSEAFPHLMHLTQP